MTLDLTKSDIITNSERGRKKMGRYDAPTLREKMLELNELMHDDEAPIIEQLKTIKEDAVKIDDQERVKRKCHGQRTFVNQYYVDKIVPLLPDLFRDGQSMEEVTGVLGISDESFLKLVGRFPEFKEAFDQGKKLSRKWWDKTGRMNSAGVINGNSVTWKFNMQNRFGWAEKQEVDSKSSDGSMTPKSAIDFEKLDDATIEKLLAAKKEEG